MRLVPAPHRPVFGLSASYFEHFNWASDYFDAIVAGNANTALRVVDDAGGDQQRSFASEFEAMGYRMVIWPVSALRMAAKVHEQLYAAIKRDGGVQSVIAQMQTRQELYQTISYADYEALDASIVKTILP